MPISVAIGGGTTNTTPATTLPEPELNNIGGENEVSDLEPVESGNRGEIILSAIGISDQVSNLPEEDADNLGEVGKYVSELIDKRGLTPTKSVYTRLVGEVMEEMGIDKDTEPSRILDRIGGMVKAWRDIVFIKDPSERRKMFMKLARLESAKDMNDLVYKEMENRKVWQ